MGVGSAIANASPFLKAHNALSHILRLCWSNIFPVGIFENGVCRINLPPSSPALSAAELQSERYGMGRCGVYCQRNIQNAHFDRQHFVVGGYEGLGRRG